MQRKETMTKSITINNWHKFQQYKDRRPDWIKLLIEIIEEFDEDGKPKKFYKMPDSAKLTFILLACLRAHFNVEIPYPDDKWLKSRLGIQKLNLQPIINAGFITINDSPVQNCTEPYKKDTPEREGEIETEREKETERDDMSSSEKVFNCWNEQRNNERWKTHKDLTPDIRAAIRKNQSVGWSADDMCGAIANFALVVQGKDYKWTYSKWGLVEFLTRGQKDDKGLRWLWFHPNNFVEKDWLTKDAIDRRIAANREKERMAQRETMENPSTVGSATKYWETRPEAELIKEYQEGNFFMRSQIDKHRPEIKAKVAEIQKEEKELKGLRKMKGEKV